MQFRSNGKLLLTAEYLVVDGATALSLPTRYGQRLAVFNLDEPNLVWESYDHQENQWFSATFDQDLNIVKTSSTEKAEYLLDVLEVAEDLNGIQDFTTGVHVNAQLEFPTNWGLGSSSTLISNVAQWFKIDPFDLHREVSNGSGYDIASAHHNSPILFSNKDGFKVEEVNFNPVFQDQMYFVHLNRKQNSFQEVERYTELKKNLNLEECVATISDLTREIANSNSLDAFNNCIDRHETFLSHILQRETIGNELFLDYQLGSIKSLGAWGGDFILATGDKNVPAYFKGKGYETVVPYSEMILNA